VLGINVIPESQKYLNLFVARDDFVHTYAQLKDKR